MKTIKKENKTSRSAGSFDAVKMMRKIREKISSETQNMTYEELKAYIKSKLQESKLKPLGK